MVESNFRLLLRDVLYDSTTIPFFVITITMQGFRALSLPQSVYVQSLSKKSDRKVLATSAHGATVYDLNYYLKGALAGGICCSITHGGLCPVDVVKTRIQLDPVTYNKG